MNTNTESNMDKLSLLARFLRVYSGLPLEERENIIVVIDNKTINWEMALREIRQGTELGKRIAEKLIILDII